MSGCSSAISLLSSVAFVLWFSTELWSQRIFGDAGYHLTDGRDVSLYITYGIVVSFAVSTVGIFVPAMLSHFFGWIGDTMTMANGRRGTATIVAIGPNSTGFNVETNDQPLIGLTLEVDNGYKAPYTVTVDATVPEYELSRHQPGAKVNVLVNKSNPKKVVYMGLISEQ